MLRNLRCRRYNGETEEETEIEISLDIQSKPSVILNYSRKILKTKVACFAHITFSFILNSFKCNK